MEDTTAQLRSKLCSLLSPFTPLTLTARIVSYTTGLAHITLPDSDDEAWFIGGNQGLLVAADTNGDGHFTDYPSEQSTVVLTLPFPGGVLPPHEVISTGPCHFSPIGGGLTRRD